MQSKVIVGAAIVRDGKLLVQQRAEPKTVKGLWELPGGKVESGETELEALRRECVEELDVVIVPGHRVGLDISLSRGKVFRVYSAELSDSGIEPRAVEHLALRWLTVDEVDDLDWLPADRELIPALRALIS